MLGRGDFILMTCPRHEAGRTAPVSSGPTSLPSVPPGLRAV